MKSSIVIAALILMGINVFAQKEAAVAFNGYKGNYIYNLFKPASPAHPDGDVVGFRLDRKLQSETNWQPLQKFNTPETFDELSGNINKAITRVYTYNKATAYTIGEVWPIFKKTFTYDSISAYLAQQHLAAAFNILLIDSGANNKVSYQYRVVQIKRDNSEGLKYVSLPVSANQYFNATKPTVKSRSTAGGKVQIVYKAKATLPATEALLIQRKEGLRTDFKRIETFYTIEQNADSVYYTIVDEEINSEQLYQYTITPVNRYGGGGIVVSDSVYASLIDKNFLLPQQFVSSIDSVTNSIVLKWKFLKPDLVSIVNVFRSEEYEDGYINIGSASENTYIDKGTVAGKKYYYYLHIMDRLGQNSLRSVKLFALLQSNKKPDAPIYVTAVKNGTGNLITWQDYNSDTRGWYIYKTDQIEGDLKRASDFIYKDGSKGMEFTYVDTTTNAAVSGYAVVAESFSNVQGKFSDTVYINTTANTENTTANIETLPPSIIDVSKSSGKYYIFWRDDVSTVDNITGYNIYRKSNDSDFEKINKIPLDITKSSYTDSLVNTGFSILYKIAVIDKYGKEFLSDEYEAAGSAEIFPASSLKSFMGTDKKVVFINWQPSQSAVSKYEIYRFTRGTDAVKIGESNSETVNFKDGSYVKDKVNYYYVIALGLNGKVSGKSNETFINPN